MFEKPYVQWIQLNETMENDAFSGQLGQDQENSKPPLLHLKIVVRNLDLSYQPAYPDLKK